MLVALESMKAMVDRTSEWVVDSQQSGHVIAALESLAIAKKLRAGDAEGALKLVDDRIQSHRVSLTGLGSPPPSSQSTRVLTEIAEYQATYPWSPPLPSPEAREFMSRFAPLAPTIQDGALIGFRVGEVRAGSVFAEIGVTSGDLITDYDGQPVSLDRQPSLAEALQSGSRVDLVVKAQDGTVRQVQVPPR